MEGYSTHPHCVPFQGLVALVSNKYKDLFKIKFQALDLYENNFKTETLIYHHSLFLSRLNKTDCLPTTADHGFSAYHYCCSAILLSITLCYFVVVTIVTSSHDIIQVKTH